jgi:hypothetical protein
MLAIEFQMDVLGRIADDYEAIYTIRGDLERDLGRVVSEEELASAFLALVEFGYADAFAYDTVSSTYERVDVGSYPVHELWFLINRFGRSICEGSNV